jgi:hypothetical protein
MTITQKLCIEQDIAELEFYQEFNQKEEENLITYFSKNLENVIEFISE